MIQTIKIDLPESKSKGLENLSEIQVEVKGDELYVTGIPDGDVIEYIARSEDSIFFVVHRHKEWFSKKDIRLHIGPELQLREATINSFKRYRDIYGDTHINYTFNGEEGNLYFPGRKKCTPLNNRIKKFSLERLI